MRQVELLRKYGLSVRGVRGQHLLMDENIQRKIAGAASPQPNETIIEIGPGLGAITELLLQAGAKVIAIEQDKRFVEILEGELGREFKNLTLVNKDILKVDFTKYVPKNAPAGRPPLYLKIVGNIPYYITSPILLHLIRFRQVIDTVLLTVQKELADRFFAQPGTKAYGRLSLLVRFYAQPQRLFEISRSCFSPKPEVDSSVVQLTFHRKLPESVNEKVLFELIKAGFSSRRKNVLNALTDGLKGQFTKEEIGGWLKEAKLDSQARAEEFLLKDFMQLSEIVEKRIRTHSLPIETGSGLESFSPSE